jgi:putative sporulation protein YyaC
MPALEEKGTIIAIDACLGKPDSVGAFLVRQGPLIPARSVNKGFGAVGTYSIAGVVNAISLKPYWTLQSTSLYRVMGMAQEISQAISKQWNKN